MPRSRKAKIVATLGPATADIGSIRALFAAGVDVFRLNASHGTHEVHARVHATIRQVEEEVGRPIAILFDLQGPKLRIGDFESREGVTVEAGARFRLDLDPRLGCARRVELPHPEVFSVLVPGTTLLINDGLVRLEVLECGPDHAETRVVVGGRLSNHKGLNVPDLVLPVSPVTDKDARDLEFGLGLGVDWVAASFVQRASDVDAVKARVGGRARLMVKLEKPAAVREQKDLMDIVDAADGVMVARGDLGVELPPEKVPSVQKRVVRACRDAGRPVVVATQMLESMVNAPVPTRAEVSDVAGAIYDGADAVMLSAETATGKYPVAAVEMMDHVIQEVESDEHYRTLMDATAPAPQPFVADAICDALRHVVKTLHAPVIATFTSSGFSTLRAARERPEAPILSLTPDPVTARQLSLVWGVHAVRDEDVREVQQMVDNACSAALAAGFAKPGQPIVIMAGMPFGISGTTNMIRVAEIPTPPTTEVE
ncbi:MAG: pyruvate kinase [Ectothiorhodospiraceae bacterium]|nr:pyruvate kinase [Chromatiales bacterium]MCP5157007.1 pyruvate kinase [Ectothiorhodospiraceae bacterium]